MSGLTLGGIIVTAYEAALTGDAAYRFGILGPRFRWQIATTWWQSLQRQEAEAILRRAGWEEPAIGAVFAKAA